MGGRKDLITAGLTLGALADAGAKAKGKMSAIIATESGSVVSFTAADAAPVADLTAAIVPVQSGSGDPSPTNIRPISGWTECNVTRAGKNLFGADIEQGSFNPSTGIPISQEKRVRSGFVPLAQGTYTTSNGSGLMVVVYIYDTNKQFLLSESAVAWKSSPFTFTLDGSRYVRFAWRFVQDTVIVPSDLTNPQVELGSAATAYEPYRGDTYTVTFGSAGTVYGGTLDVTTGKLTVDRAVVDLGDSNLSWKASSQIGKFYCSKAPDYKPGADTEMMCSIYKFDGAVTSSPYYGENGTIRCWARVTSTINRELYVHDDRFSDLASFVSAMSGVQLVYELATPLVYNLTPVEIRTLGGENTIWADTGSVTVKYTADTKAFIDNYIAARRNG